jgi:phage-related protein
MFLLWQAPLAAVAVVCQALAVAEAAAVAAISITIFYI